ncbi:type II secretion system F family protein [Candidatus Pelagibacter ubique]|nr:type II secretion system F family protein [Candidatus Pelagibacter ubique]MDC0372963.1 type II secretion system F family protein [Candidatus Pelagibacter ubique]MDC0557997.1 type II secretion system F family protein [Candidatus Pelagibacter ubique]MDC0890206.1 type II secretion system F family protein [Candidatus Pelagibacter ubique]
MLNFNYTGKKEGQDISGLIEALNKPQAIAKLRAQKITVSKINEAKANGSSGGADPEIKTFLGMQLHSDKLSDLDVMMFSKKLETMMKADLPIMDSILLARRQATKPGMIKLTNSIIEDLNQGRPFSTALEKFPKNFDDSYVNMVKAGESSGTLALFLNKIVSLVEKKLKIIKDIKGALTYPIILLTVALLVTTVMLVKVVPVFEEIYGSLGVPLPAATQKVIAMSNFLTNPSQGGVLVVSIIAIVTTLIFLNKKVYAVKKFFHGFSLKIPAFGPLVIKSIYAKLSMVLSNLLTAGVPIIEALEISSRVTTNILVREAIARIQEEILTGKNLSELFAGEKIFPMEFSEFMKVGERTGSVDEMFNSLATYYEAEVDNAVGALKQFIEPVMIVLIGALIAGLLLTLYQPIFNMGQVVK